MINTNCTIRPAEYADLPRILEIYEEARAFMRRTGNPTQWGESQPAEEILREDIPKGHLYVCTESNEILGVFAYIRGIDPTYIRIYEGQWLNDEPYGVIHRIAVSSRRKGVASLCFDWALSQCPDLRIDTHRQNRPMQRALQKAGFTCCGIIYLASGDERIAFHKTIL